MKDRHPMPRLRAPMPVFCGLPIAGIALAIWLLPNGVRAAPTSASRQSERAQRPIAQTVTTGSARGLAVFRIDPLGVDGRIVARLDGLLRIELARLADAAMRRRRWLRDFEDDEITISKDLYEVIMAYQFYQRPSA